MYGVTVVTEPTGEPITLEEAKSYLRVINDDEDSDIEHRIIPTARERVETATNRQLLTATLELSLDCFPSGGEPIYLPKAPLREVNSIVHQGSAGDQQTLDAADYLVNTKREPGVILPVHGKPWPNTKYRSAAETVVINFDAGYGESHDVPAGLRMAMLMMCSHMYEHRSEVIVGTISSVLPRAVDVLLTQFSYGDEFEVYG